MKESFEQTEGQPLAGVIIVSDGGQNMGIEPLSLTEQSKSLDVPLYTVGVGSLAVTR